MPYNNHCAFASHGLGKLSAREIRRVALGPDSRTQARARPGNGRAQRNFSGLPEVEGAGSKKDSRNVAGKNLAVPHGARVAQRSHSDRKRCLSGLGFAPHRFKVRSRTSAVAHRIAAPMMIPSAISIPPVPVAEAAGAAPFRTEK
jgi:hypothetical protein